MRTRPSPRAFTLLELLIVVAVIGILTALALAIGARVAGSGKSDKTAKSIKALDLILNDYVSTQGSIPPATVVDPRPGNAPPNVYIQPVADASVADVSSGADRTLNSVGFFLLQARDAAGGDAILKGLDTRFVRTFDADGPDAGTPDWETQPELLTAIDAWDRPLRYVHPKFGSVHYGSDRTQYIQTASLLGISNYGITRFRRNSTAETGAPDSDGGMPRGGTPYFYSAGPDGMVGYRVDSSGAVLEDYNKDNVYSVKPEFAKDWN